SSTCSGRASPRSARAPRSRLRAVHRVFVETPSLYHGALRSHYRQGVSPGRRRPGVRGKGDFGGNGWAALPNTEKSNRLGGGLGGGLGHGGLEDLDRLFWDVRVGALGRGRDGDDLVGDVHPLHHLAEDRVAAVRRVIEPLVVLDVDEELGGRAVR